MESRKTGLGEKERDLLQRHWKTLKRDLRMSDIADDLIVGGVISPPTWDDLKRKHKIEKERTEEFLQSLLRKPSKSFGIFRDALRENYEHLADKLDTKDEAQRASTSRKHTSSGKQTPDAVSIDLSEIKKVCKDLSDRDKLRSEEIAAMKQEFQEQKKTSQKFERQLATNLQQTNKELTKLKEALKEKENEIENLQTAQRQQEGVNKDLSEQNRALETVREKMTRELQLKTSEQEELELELKKQKLYQDKMTREKKKLKEKLERQNTLLEEEKEKKNNALESLQRERTSLERIEKEKEEMQEMIETLENDNCLLSSRPQTARSDWTVSSVRNEASGMTTLYRRQPTGISQSDDNISTTMTDLINQRKEIEEEIKRKQTEQKYLRMKLRDLQSPTDSVDGSKTCALQ